MGRLLAIAVSLALSACSLGGTIADHGVAYNKTVAESADSQMLLNVLRARDRNPMHFTAITQISGTLRQTFSSTLAWVFPFGGDALANFTASPSSAYALESNPTTQYVNLDVSSEFMNAIAAPMNLKDVKYFIDQG